MPQSTLSDFEQKELIRDPRLGGALALITAMVLLAIPLINSPGMFSQRHLEDTSLLRRVVDALALNGRFPTARGVEIRNLFYFCGAALLSGVAGIYLLFSRVRPRHSLDDLTDIRERAKNPYFWWVVLLLVSVLSSWYSHAPRLCLGQTTIRFMHFAWWFPLAAFLRPQQVRMLCCVLLTALTLGAFVGIWYQFQRGPANIWSARLGYPLGNELWMAACMLPGVFLSLGLHKQRIRHPAGRLEISAWKFKSNAVVVLAGATTLFALVLTHSRSAMAGLTAGVIAYVFFLVTPRKRPTVLLAGLVLGIVGALAAQQLRVEGVMGQRAHSIRSRLNYEWPYAIKLFVDKPVAGNGDGAYSMLAGQYARADQLEDPSVLRFDESSWTAHAHNEFLELLADLGVVGMLSFACALGLTLLYAARFCDRQRRAEFSSRDRLLVAGLGGALVALLVDQCTETALREPGLAPILFSVWAMLWAMIRRERLVKFEMREEERLPNYLLRFMGGMIIIGAIYLGFAGMRDWQAARARYEAKAALESQNYEAAVAAADMAAAGLLDPFQRNQARMIAAWARSLLLDRALVEPSAQVSNQQLDIARIALAQLATLKNDAPRFLKVSRLEAELSLNVARALERRRDIKSAQDFQRRFLAALERSRADEPFSFERVFAEWQARRDAGAVERITWLRALIRGGTIDPATEDLIKQLEQSTEFAGAMNDLINIAMQDAKRPADGWRDELSPETFRLAAKTQALRGRWADASKDAEAAERMYEMAGSRLFAAHAALLHEWVEYDIAAVGDRNTQQNLERLAKAWSISQFPVSPTEPLPGEIGRTRLRVLELANRQEDAEKQRRKLAEDK
jgi:O-antigen ligase